MKEQQLGFAVIAAPKSASTFIYEALRRLLDLQPAGILQTDGPTGPVIAAEADLRRAYEIRSRGVPSIGHQHLLPNANTLEFLNRSGLHPIIVWRDVGDSIVSLRDYLERQWSVNFEQIAVQGSTLQFVGTIPPSFVEGFLLSGRAAAPRDPECNRQLASAYADFGRLLLVHGGLAEARPYLESALAVYGRLQAAAPRDPECNRQLASAYADFGRLLLVHGGLAEARPYLASALAVYGRLQAAEPRDLECNRQLAALYAEFGRLVLAQGERDEASRYFASAAAVYDHMLQQGRTAAVLEEMAQNFMLQAETYLSIGDLTQGAAEYRRALSILAQLYALDPKSKEVLLAHLQAYRGVADAFATLGDRDSEIDALHSTIAVLGQLEDLEPDSSWTTDIEQVAKRLPQNPDIRPRALSFLAKVLGSIRSWCSARMPNGITISAHSWPG